MKSYHHIIEGDTLNKWKEEKENEMSNDEQRAERHVTRNRFLDILNTEDISPSDRDPISRVLDLVDSNKRRTLQVQTALHSITELIEENALLSTELTKARKFMNLSSANSIGLIVQRTILRDKLIPDILKVINRKGPSISKPKEIANLIADALTDYDNVNLEEEEDA